MVNLIAKLFKKSPDPIPVEAEDFTDDIDPVFESLAMTDELRDALFPKSTQMISAIFDRPAPLHRPSAMPSYGHSSGSLSIPL